MDDQREYELGHELNHKYSFVTCVDRPLPLSPRSSIETWDTAQRKGWSRPDQFTSSWAEAGYVFSISMSQFLDEYLTSGFFALIPTLIHDLALSSTSATWSAGVISLVVSALLLTFGRLVDMYGGLPVFVGGIAWTFVWTLPISLATDARSLIVCRAMQGLGAAAHLPAGLALLGKTYQTGQRKNVVFSIYGAMAPLGSFFGILTASLALQHGHWSIFFSLGSVLAFLVCLSIHLTRPWNDQGDKDPNVCMDWTGSISLSASLALLVFSLTQAADATQGWRTPYIIWTGAFATVGLLITVGLEGWVATQPLLPPTLFKIRGIAPLLFGLLLTYGAVTLFVCYATLYAVNVTGVGPMQMLAWFTPMAIGGCFLAIGGGWLMSFSSETLVLSLSCVGNIVASLLFIIAPRDPPYWVYVFPAMICETISMDLTFNQVNVFLSSKLPSHQQGVAGGLSHSLIHLSAPLLLGLARELEAMTTSEEAQQRYVYAFWLQYVCGMVAFVAFSISVSVRAVDGGPGDTQRYSQNVTES